MPVNVAEWAAAGLSAIQIGERSPEGYFVGYAGLTTDDSGTNSGMHRLKAAITAPVGIPEPVRVNTRGDNDPKRHVFFFKGAGDNGFTLDMGSTDVAAEAFMQGSTVYTLGQWDMAVRGISLPAFTDMVMLLTRQAQSDEDGNSGNGYENLLIFSTNGLPLGDDQFDFQGEGGARYTCSANAADILPWGVSLTTANSTSDGLTYSWFSEYPCTLESFVGDGSTVAIPLTYPPVSILKTQVFRADTAAASTVSSVSTGGMTATVSVAPTDEKYYIVVYETAGL